jgi:hypothetical protein
MKKKLLFAIIAFASISYTKAQAPDFNFETWVPAYPPFVTIENPKGWATLNILNSPFTGSMPQTVFKDSTGIIPSGSYAAKIVTNVVPPSVSIPNPFRPGKNLDTIGFMGVGAVLPGSPPSLKLGYPFASRPAILSFSSKYTPNGTDTAFVVAYLTRSNGTTRDTIASGQYTTAATTTTYSPNSLSMNYKPAFNNVWSDTMLVFVTSSVYSHAGAKKGSTFYIDNLAWSGFISTDDIDATKSSVSVFPNPAIANIQLKCSVKSSAVEVVDVTGRKMGLFEMHDNKVDIKTNEFVPGIYLYSVLNERKEVINRGKFEITK